MRALRGPLQVPVHLHGLLCQSEEEELSETEADAPSLKFGGQYINTALEKLGRFQSPLGTPHFFRDL